MKDAPPWMFRLVEQLNQQIELLTTALQNNVTLAENLNAEIRTVDLDHDIAVRIGLNQLKGKPVGVVLLGTGVFDYARIAWDVIDESTVDVKVKWDTDPGVNTAATIAFIGS